MAKTTTSICSELIHTSRIPSRFVLPPELRVGLPSANEDDEKHETADEVEAGAAATDDADQVPVIDISDLQEWRAEMEAKGWESLEETGGGAAAAAVMDRIHAACREWGVLQVVGHGVELASLESLHLRFREFLERGGKFDGGEFGKSYVNPDAGTAEWREHICLHTQPPDFRDYNKWTPFFREDVEKVSDGMLGLCRFLLAVLSQKFGLDVESALGGVLHQKLLLSHYPPCPQPELAIGSFQHTDIGVLTCVWQPLKDVRGLQVLHPDGQRWLHVPALPNAIFINIGDQLQILSNGLYRSGPHRVVLNTSKSRVSIISFHNPHSTAIISPASKLIDEKHPPKFDSASFGSLAKEREIDVI